MTSLFAFLYHLATFTLVDALAAEQALLQDRLAPKSARTILLADFAYGVSAGTILIVG